MLSLWKSMATSNSLVTNILQNIFLCALQKNELCTDLKHFDGEKMMPSFSHLGELSLY